MLLNMALTGGNGDNETKIGSSRSISYSLYDENKNEMAINNLDKKIEYWIPKDPSVDIEPYKYIDALNATVVNDTTKFVYKDGAVLNGFRLSGTNVSIHIQIKPDSRNGIIATTVGYLFLLKFGENPNINTTNFYDEWNIYCPSGLLKF